MSNVLEDQIVTSLTKRHWKFKKNNQRLIQTITEQYDLSSFMATLLSSRNISSNEVNNYINPTLKDNLPNPSIMSDMVKASDRTFEALKKSENIAVLGDYDVDGSTSVAMIVKYFQSLGVSVHFHIPNRFTEGYGPNKEVFKKFSQDNVKLVFTVDCGTMSYSEMEFAKEEGLDVIVLDHHQPEAKYPEAFAFINPNRFDDDSQLGYLAAVGVSFMFLVSLNRKLRSENWFVSNNLEEPNLIAFLDLIALGTICDSVPLKGINRLMVIKGLEVIQKRKNHGLNALIDIAEINQKVSVYDLGFKLGPRINAAGRIGKSNFGVDLLISNDRHKAQEISSELEKFNLERKTIENHVYEMAKQQVNAEMKESKIIVVYDEGWHEGVIGIIASRLKDKYKKPAIVLSVNDGIAKGSGRSIKGIDLGNMIISANQNGILDKGGGHAMAAGMTLNKDKIPELINYLNTKLVHKNDHEDHQLSYLDMKLSASAINIEVFNEVESLGPYGSENPEPIFFIDNIKITSLKKIGSDHLKCLGRSENGKFTECLAFRSVSTSLGEQLYENEGKSVSLIGKIKVNEWGGRKIPQFHIEDIASTIA